MSARPGQFSRDSVRILFCFNVLPAFFDLADGPRKEVFDALVDGFGDLGGRFGVKVLGTLDDDQTAVGPTFGWPHTSFILADAPNAEAVNEVCNLLRTIYIGEHRLWRYMKVETRIGRELFFGNS